MALKRKQIKLIEFLWVNYKTFKISEILNLNFGYQNLISVIELLLNDNILWTTSNKETFEFNPKATEDHIYKLLGISLTVERKLSLPESESEYVYVYYYPTYKSHAFLNDVPIYPCKVGSTTHGLPLLRCVEQLNTSTPEIPTIALLIKCSNSERIERFLHARLKANNRHLKHFFNSEWFLTNSQEIEQMVSQFKLDY